jgi:uncharacterized damage-inducible protein DinB
MMVTPEYVQVMSMYNKWQNNQLYDIINVMSEDVLTLDRGAFFGSIHATLAHLLWGDLLWMQRFDPNRSENAGSFPESHAHWSTISHWAADRMCCDGEICLWAAQLSQDDINGDLSFYSSSLSKIVNVSLSLSIVQFFNHQTHHRGQVHAMLTAAGENAPVSDLIYIPEVL